MNLREVKRKFKRRACGLCKPHKRGDNQGGSSRGAKAIAAERADAEQVREELAERQRWGMPG